MFLKKLEHRVLAALFRRAANRGEDIPWMRRHDQLTGLLNRNAFAESMRAKRSVRAVEGAIAMLDLDFFKMVNDRHGHAAGDLVLRTMAQRISALVPKDVVVARCGGEEFCLFIPGAMAQARLLADALVTEARRPIALDEGVSVTVSASVGFTEISQSIPLDDALNSADMALYAAKSNGRDQALEFNLETQTVVSARRELAHAVAKLQERNRVLQHQVETDALTGLFNRRALDQVLSDAKPDPLGTSKQFAVAFLDIDHFGSYNKRHGDGRGDETLRQVSETIQRTARKNDLVFRKGGEEIVVLLPDATDAEARAAAERMRDAVQALGIRHDGSATAEVVTVTVGIASTRPDEHSTVQDLMDRAADAAMQAKLRSERNRVHVA